MAAQGLRPLGRRLLAEVFLDVDTTVEPLFGSHEGARPGSNPHYHARPSYHPVLARVAETDTCVGALLRPGDTAFGEAEVPVVERWVERLRRAVGPACVIHVCVDAAGDCAALLAALDRLGCRATVKARMTRDLCDAIATLPEGRWRSVDWGADGRVARLRRQPRRLAARAAGAQPFAPLRAAGRAGVAALARTVAAAGAARGTGAVGALGPVLDAAAGAPAHAELSETPAHAPAGERGACLRRAKRLHRLEEIRWGRRAARPDRAPPRDWTRNRRSGATTAPSSSEPAGVRSSRRRRRLPLAREARPRRAQGGSRAAEPARSAREPLTHPSPSGGSTSRGASAPSSMFIDPKQGRV
jgi:hypothetical protein